MPTAAPIQFDLHFDFPRPLQAATRVTRMNRLVVALLSVLIFLVAAHGFLEWRAQERAEDAAQQSACIQRTEATATIGLIVPALITPSEDLDRDSQIRALASLSAQLDDC